MFSDRSGAAISDDLLCSLACGGSYRRDTTTDVLITPIMTESSDPYGAEYGSSGSNVTGETEIDKGGSGSNSLRRSYEAATLQPV